MATLIRPIADAEAGTASHITVQAFNDSELLTALRNGSGNLELIGWHTPPGDAVVTRAADSASQAGTAQEVALALMGRRAITAVRSGSGKLLLISWDVPPGLGAITRTWDSGTAAGDATNIAMAAISDTMLVTAVRAGNGKLLLISWRLEPDGTLSRLHDSGSLAGGITVVTIAAIDAANVVTAVRNLSGNLELIGWSIGGDGSITRWAGGASEAGAVFGIAIATVASAGPSNDILTAVQNGSGNLLLIAWRPSPIDGTIARLADSGSEAGEASDLALTSTVTSTGAPTILVSMRNGSGVLEIIAFELIADAAGAIVIRTGDYTGLDTADVTQTALASLGTGRIVSANRVNNDLDVATYSVGHRVTTLIRPIAEAAAGDATAIAVQAFNASDVLTAFRDASGNLELIGWRAPAQDFTITRAGEGHAGTVQEVAVALMGRRAVTAVQSGSGTLLLISWDTPPGLATITRLADIGAGEATNIAVTAVTDTVLVTALRNGSGNLLLISWRLDASTGGLTRLHEASAGAVSLVTIIALDSANVVTAVRNGSGNLELIGWSVAADGSIQRWGDSGSQAGEVGEIAVLRVAGTALTSDVVTAVRDGSGNLLLIAWRLSPSSGSIERLADSGSEAGTASDIAITSAVTATGTPTILVLMQRGNGNLEIIAFELIADDAGATIIVRTGDYSSAANTLVIETALTPLEPGRILSACRIAGLALATYSVTDAATTPAPAEILELKFDNPDLSITNDPDWAASGGATFPRGPANEWIQVLAPKDEYDKSSLVGGSGWVIDPDYSGADVPFDHPFGFDYEFQVALDDEYARLISPANGEHEEGESIHRAAELGLPVTRGLLGVEWDKKLLPQSFRAQVNHGDRVALVGRWILDTGHDFGGNYRTEIHPPLLAVAANLHRYRRGEPFTRAVFLARPFLAGQTYTVDVNDAYHDASPGDGSLEDHFIHELVKVVTLRSRRIEAYPKIKSLPFRGRHQLHAIVRPPQRPDTGSFQLAVSFQFTVRAGCTVEVSPAGDDAVDVAISFNEGEYVAPPLPPRTERDYFPPELDVLSSGAGLAIVLVDDLTKAVSVILGGILLGEYVQFVLGRGIRTDEYAALAELNVLDTSNAVVNTSPQNIPPGDGVVADNVQPYPLFGWLEARWVPIMTKKPTLTTANVNQWLKGILADPARARQLKENWVELVLNEFSTTKDQVESLALIPAEHAKDLHTAIGRVVDHGGTIEIERDSEQSPGRLVVTPKPADPKVAELSVGIFHCRFDAHCRNWHCGWGPARK